MPKLSTLDRLLEDAVKARHPPAAQAAVFARGELVHSSAHGVDEAGAPVDEACLFDLASVTKLAATTLSIARLVRGGRLDLDGPIGRVLEREPSRPALSARSLLAHTSGLAGWAPLFVRAMEDAHAASIYPPARSRDAEAFARARELVFEGIHETARHEPGIRVYSDLGFMLLGAVVEAISGASLARFAQDEVFAPLGLEEELGFFDLARPSGFGRDRRVLATGDTRPREPAPGQEALYRVHGQPPRLDPGEVDDDHAFALGGVAGHAGLFGTASALARLGEALLEAHRGGDALLREWMAPQPAKGPERGLGFDRPAGEGSLVGPRFGRLGPWGAVGHLGFTGCSLWIDLDRELVAALTSNRTRPGRRHVAPIRALRPAFHEALVDLS